MGRHFEPSAAGAGRRTLPLLLLLLLLFGIASSVGPIDGADEQDESLEAADEGLEEDIGEAPDDQEENNFDHEPDHSAGEFGSGAHAKAHRMAKEAQEAGESLEVKRARLEAYKQQQEADMRKLEEDMRRQEELAATKKQEAANADQQVTERAEHNISRERWGQLTPDYFKRTNGSKGLPLLLSNAVRVQFPAKDESRQAANWTMELILAIAGKQELQELTVAKAPEVEVSFGHATVLEDSTHAAIFAALQPLHPVFSREGPLVRLRKTRFFYIIEQGAGFHLLSHPHEDSYNILLHGPSQLWWFPEAEDAEEEMPFKEVCRRWQLTLHSDHLEKSFSIKQEQGDAVWVPAGRKHAVCAGIDSENTDLVSVSMGGRGDAGNWTKLMFAARDGNVQWLQRAQDDVKAKPGGSIAQEINKVVDNGGPEGSVATATQIAASSGHVAALDWLLERRADIGGPQFSPGEPHPHHLAAAHGHTSAIAALVKARADISAKVGFGNAAEWAYHYGHMDVVEWLEEQGHHVRDDEL